MNHYIISIDRASKKCAIFNAQYGIVRDFQPYTSEVDALAEARCFVRKEYHDDDPDVVYPFI